MIEGAGVSDEPLLKRIDHTCREGCPIDQRGLRWGQAAGDVVSHAQRTVHGFLFAVLVRVGSAHVRVVAVDAEFLS